MKYVTGIGCVWDSPEHNEIEALRKRVVELQRQLALNASMLADATERQRQLNEVTAALAEREKEIADLIHPHDLAKYRSRK